LSIGSSFAGRPVVPRCGAIRRIGGTLTDGDSNRGASATGSGSGFTSGAGVSANTGAGAGANLRISPRDLKKEYPAEGTRDMEGEGDAGRSWALPWG
jgi:hypothetical protein